MKSQTCCEEIAEYESLPHISIVIPFDAKMKSKAQLEKVLSGYAAQTEKDLLRKYEPQQVMPLMKKLKMLITKIDDASDKSIAIFISSFTEKVIYFDRSDYLENHPYPKV
jgi:hypothetical protein